MPERTKKLIPLQTVVGAININVKGQLTTFNVLYSGAMVPWINGEMLFLQGKRYNDMLRDFFENEGREYIIPTVTEINQIQAAVINDYKAGKFIDPSANTQSQEEQAEETNDTSNIADSSNEEEIEDEVPEEDEYEDEEDEQFEDNTADDDMGSEDSVETQEGFNSEQEEVEDENSNVEYIENDVENMFGSDETTTESYDEEDYDSEIVNKDADNQKSEEALVTRFETSNVPQRNDYRKEQSEVSNYKYDAVNDVADYEKDTDIVRYKHAPKNINYNFNDTSLDELKEIIDNQNKIMMQQNEMILNLSTSVTEQQKSIDEFKKKINNSNVFCKTNLHKTIIAMIICLFITIGAIVGMQLYAPKMESAIALDPNTDAEVHIVIHNDDGTDTFERIGTIRIVDGKLVTSDVGN